MLSKELEGLQAMLLSFRQDGSASEDGGASGLAAASRRLE